MIGITRRAAVAGLAAALARAASADDLWPTRPVTLVHGFPPGGPVDSLSRILADALSRRISQQVIVESKPGATGTMAGSFVARAAPDGYTLLAVPATHVATAVMYRSLPYRPIEDFSLISTTAEYPFVLATHADHPIRTVADLIERARSTRDPLQYGTPGAGSLQHLSIELLALAANIRLQQIPYRGGAPAITDLLGKRLDLVIDPPTSLFEHIRSGRLRAVAVTSRTRFSDLPDVPTIAESGFSGYAVSGYQGIAAPAGLSPGISQQLQRHIAGILQDAAVIAKLQTIGNSPIPSSPDGFKSRLAKDITQWSQVIADRKIERI
jgi:tripartite-type tricarboxylate transporter receptor subunit TctC